ncbi:MAG: hypothetical protein JJU36_13865 [Phycisphaeraceae bacterium]|nr:hypothetical protein [Phycisphaeraceae bacterium]
MMRPFQVFGSAFLASAALMLLATGSTASDSRISGDSVNRAPVRSLDARDPDNEQWVTVQTTIYNNDQKPILTPVIAMKVGQRCDLVISQDRTDTASTERLSFGLHLLAYDAGYYHVSIEAEMISGDSPWAFQTTTFIRADQLAAFRWTDSNGDARSIELVLFEGDVIE